MLCLMAFHWLSDSIWPYNLIGAVSGFFSGIVIYHFGFSKIAQRNIKRIAGLPNQVCLFAFQAWRSYLLILIMMCFGFLLRHSSLPRIALAMIYLSIGTALTLSSSLYYQKLI